MTIDNLKGIGKAKEKASSTEAGLQNLMKLEKVISENIESQLYKDYNYVGAMGDLLIKFGDDHPYNEDDLKDYIMIKCDSTKKGAQNGFMTSVFLENLTSRNKWKGKRTKFHIDGHGKRFDYLFYCANRFDELIIENFKGQSIAHNIASDSGKANTLILKDIEGIELGICAGNYNGEIKNFAMINCKTNYHPFYASKDCKVEVALEINNEITQENEGYVYRESKFGVYLTRNKILDGDTKRINHSNISLLITEEGIEGFFTIIDHKTNMNYAKKIISLSESLKTQSADEIIKTVQEISEIYSNMRKK